MATAFRDRIIEVRTVPASSIVPAAINPNLHDDQQKAALRAALTRRGITGIPLVVERDGKLRMIDGHLRREALGDQPVKVAVLDLTEKEEREELIAHDQIARLAQIDRSAQLELVEQTEPEALESLGLTEEDMAFPEEFDAGTELAEGGIGTVEGKYLLAVVIDEECERAVRMIGDKATLAQIIAEALRRHAPQA